MSPLNIKKNKAFVRWCEFASLECMWDLIRIKTLEMTGISFLFICGYQVLKQCREFEFNRVKRSVMEIPLFKTRLC